MTTPTKFEVGKTYKQCFISDSTSFAYFTIISRTEKSIKTEVHNKVVSRRIVGYNGVEQFKPFGTYSMCMVIGADKVEA